MGASSVLDVQILNLETLSWSSPSLSGSPPEARSRHSANRFGQYIYLFGGGDNQRLFSDVWQLDLRTSTWSLVNTQGTPPSGRWGHTATLVDTRLFIFGGHDGVHRLNDVHVLDVSTMTWFTPDCKAKAPPSPRSLPSPASSSSSSTFDDSNVSPSAMSGDETTLDASQGSGHDNFYGGMETAKPSPCNRSSAPSSPITRRSQSPSTIITSPFSIASTSPSSSTTASAATTATTSKRGGVVIPPLQAAAARSSSLLIDGIPLARAGHSANCLGRKLIVYGGGDGKLLGDMYYLHVDTYEWSSMESGNVPDRCAHTSEVVYTPGGSRLLVFGGSNGIKTFNDLYLVTCSKNRVRAPSGKRKSNSLIKSNSSIPVVADSNNGIGATGITGLVLNSSSSSSATAEADASSMPPLTVNVRLAQSSPRSPHSPKSPKSPRSLPTLSYKDVLQKEPQKSVPPKTQLKMSGPGSGTVPVLNATTPAIALPAAITTNNTNNTAATSSTAVASSSLSTSKDSHFGGDKLFLALKELGLERFHAKFVEQEISFNQIPSLTDVHYQALGLTSIRDKALMAKLKEMAQTTPPTETNKTNKTTSNPPAAIIGGGGGARTSAWATPAQPKFPVSSSSSPQQQQQQGTTSELVRKVQLSTDALASAADSLRAAANKAILAEE
jgi:hypothetical protein